MRYNRRSGHSALLPSCSSCGDGRFCFVVRAQLARGLKKWKAATSEGRRGAPQQRKGVKGSKGTQHAGNRATHHARQLPSAVKCADQCHSKSAVLQPAASCAAGPAGCGEYRSGPTARPEPHLPWLSCSIWCAVRSYAQLVGLLLEPSDVLLLLGSERLLSNRRACVRACVLGPGG